MGKLTTNGPFSIAMLVYQWVIAIVLLNLHSLLLKPPCLMEVPSTPSHCASAVHLNTSGHLLIP